VIVSKSREAVSFYADDMEDEDEVMAEDNDDGFSPETLKLGGKKVNRRPVSSLSLIFRRILLLYL